MLGIIKWRRHSFGPNPEFEKNGTQITFSRTAAALADSDNSRSHIGDGSAVGEPSAVQLREAIIALFKAQAPQSIEAPWLENERIQS